MLQMVFNISTWPILGGGREGGCGQRPPLLSTLKAILFQENNYDCGWVSLHGKHILHSIAKIYNSNDYNIVIDQ